MRRRVSRWPLLIVSIVPLLAPPAALSAAEAGSTDLPARPAVLHSQPARVPMSVPGKKLGQHSTRWLGPYVLYSEVRVGEGYQITITWFDRQGAVLRQLAGKDLDIILDGCVCCGDRVYAINGDWSFAPAYKAREEGFVESSHDSVAFLAQYDPTDDQIAGDLYLRGKLSASIGPFLRYRGAVIQLGDDGCTSVLAWRTREKKTPQVLAFNSAGELRLRGDCDETASRSIVAPGARGALVERWKDGQVYSFYSTDGRRVDLLPGVHPEFDGWLPNSTRALFEIDSGTERRYDLVECATGAVLWQLKFEDSAHLAQIGTDVGYIFFARFNPSLWLLPGIGVRSLYAVDVSTAKPVAEWVPEDLETAYRWGSNWPSFLRLGDTLYFVTDSEFAQVNLDDIAAHRNGWRAWPPTQTPE